MAIRNVWTVTNSHNVVSYKLQYSPGATILDSIENLHREITFIFGGTSLDVSLNSDNAFGAKLAASTQELNDRTVFEVCKELMHGKEVITDMDDNAGVAAIIYDWVYIQAIIQRFGDTLNLNNFSFFTDLCSNMCASYSGARSVAVLKALSANDNMEIIDDFERFSEWHAEHVAEPIDAPIVDGEYRILKKMNDHISLVSRLPKDFIGLVTDKLYMHLWEESGRYILYFNEFCNEWLEDFSI